VSTDGPGSVVNLNQERGQHDDTHPGHFLSVSELFKPFARIQVQVEHVFRRHGGLSMGV